MMNNITIITKLNNKIYLGIMEPLLVKDEKPIINIQGNDFLVLYICACII